MKPPRRQVLYLAAGAAALPAVSQIAKAQAYPTRPITIIVPFSPGGPTDVIGRVLVERMRASLGQPIIIENVTGAGGSIGVGRVARAAPDGYTLVIGIWSTHVVNGALYALQYDVLNDFEPVALISRELGLIIVAKKTAPAKDLHELIEWLKASHGRALFGTAGMGSPGHIAGVLFQNLTGAPFQFVHYRGAAPNMQDLVAGQMDMGISTPITSLPQVRAGLIKAYAVTVKSRLSSAPDIPTVDEAGLPGMYLSVWFALWAPNGTPTNAIAKLNLAVRRALADPLMGSRLADLGHEIFPPDQQTPEALAALQKAEIEKWWPILKAANIKGE